MIFGLFEKKIPYNRQEGARKFQNTVINLASTEITLFNIDNPDHLTRIRECTAAVNEHLPTLQNRDKHIATGFTIAGASLALSSVIPFGLTIAMSGVAYGTYFLGGRDEPYNKFNTALEQLAHCCDWALSDVENTAKFEKVEIKAMLKTLAPLVTREDLIEIMGSEEEADRVVYAIEELNKQAKPEVVNETSTPLIGLAKPTPFKLATREDLGYHLYGYKQGGTLASLTNVVRIYFQQAFAYIWNLIAGTSNVTATNATPNNTPTSPEARM